MNGQTVKRMGKIQSHRSEHTINTTIIDVLHRQYTKDLL